MFGTNYDLWILWLIHCISIRFILISSVWTLFSVTIRTEICEKIDTKKVNYICVYKSFILFLFGFVEANGRRQMPCFLNRILRGNFYIVYLYYCWQTSPYTLTNPSTSPPPYYSFFIVPFSILIGFTLKNE